MPRGQGILPELVAKMDAWSCPDVADFPNVELLADLRKDSVRLTLAPAEVAVEATAVRATA
jgi:hypothetical protein